jgi:hypothetical protein
MFKVKFEKVLRFIEPFLLAAALYYGAIEVDNCGYQGVSLVMSILSFIYEFIAAYYFVEIFWRDEEE